MLSDTLHPDAQGVQGLLDLMLDRVTRDEMGEMTREPRGGDGEYILDQPKEDSCSICQVLSRTRAEPIRRCLGDLFSGSARKNARR